MGNYDRTRNMIEDTKEEIVALRERYNALSADKEKIENELEYISERIYEKEVEIGELNGYLEELAEMDGYDSYAEYEEDEMLWDYPDED